MSMSIFERMSSINQRIQQIQGRFGTSNINFTPASMGLGPAQQASAGGPTQASGVTFEQLLATYTGDKSGYVHGPSQTPYAGKESDFAGTIKEASTKFNVDEDLIRAVIRQESGFNARAESSCGAMGLMQLMPTTAADLGVKNAWDPRENVMGGVKYLKSLLDRFDGNITKALAGYNAGPGAVEKHGGVPPFAETQNYVRSILGMYEDYKKKS
jgi:hypothetical protein